ncbi:MAG: hypothetical protein ACTHQE_06680 [Thermomicrobiales bacterium]
MPISPSVTTTTSTIWLQVIQASRLLRERAVQRNVLAGFVVLVAAILLAPSDDVGGWDWLRLLLMGVLATLSILTMSASRHVRIRLETRQARIIGASILFVLALLVGLTFGLGSAAIFSLGFSLLTIQALNLRRDQAPWQLVGLLVLLVPFWVWTALGAWTGGLLLLLPIAALALIGDEHMRQAASPHPEPGDPLSWRAHRLASWIAILLAAALTLIVALTTSIPDTWVAIGALGAIGFIALEIGYPRADDAPRDYSVLFADLAFVWIVFCWLVSL